MPLGLQNPEESLAMISFKWPPSPLSCPSSTVGSAATMTGLPTELLVQIFQTVDCFATASALSKTSHRLQSIWSANANAILPRIVDCFPQAHELATAQSSARSRLYPASSPQFTMSTAQRITDNHMLASMTVAHFSNHVAHASSPDDDDDSDSDSGLPPPRRRVLSPDETADFTRAHYRALTLATESGPGRRIPRSGLDGLDLLSYLQMREAMSFMKTQCQIVTVHTVDRASPPPTTTTGVQGQFLSATAALFLELLDADLEALPGYPGEVVEEDLFARPFCYFCVADGYAGKSEGVARGVRMKDLLARIGDRGWYLR